MGTILVECIVRQLVINGVRRKILFLHANRNLPNAALRLLPAFLRLRFPVCLTGTDGHEDADKQLAPPPTLLLPLPHPKQATQHKPLELRLVSWNPHVPEPRSKRLCGEATCRFS